MAKIDLINSAYKINGKDFPNVDFSITNEFLGLNAGTGSVWVVYENGRQKNIVYSTETIEATQKNNVVVLTASEILGHPFKGIRELTTVAIPKDIDLVIEQTIDGKAKITIQSLENTCIISDAAHAAVLLLFDFNFFSLPYTPTLIEDGYSVRYVFATNSWEFYDPNSAAFVLTNGSGTTAGVDNVDLGGTLTSPATITGDATNKLIFDGYPIEVEAPTADAHSTTKLYVDTADTASKDRANHTGTQLSSTISNFADTVRATLLTGLSLASTAVISASDSILSAIGKLQAQVSLNNAKVTNATHTGDVTGDTALTIAANAVTNSKAAQMATKTYKGRTTAGTGDPEDVPVATLLTDLDVYTTTEVDALFLPPIAATYTDTTAMIAAQGAQTSGFIYKVTTPSVAYYEYLGTIIGDITDYSNVTSDATAAPNKATQPQAEAGTNNTNFMTPLRVVQLLEGNYRVVKSATGWEFYKPDGVTLAFTMSEDGQMTFSGSTLASLNFEAENGSNFIALEPNLTDALSIISGVNKIMQVDTTAGSEKLRFFAPHQVETYEAYQEADLESDIPTPPTDVIHVYAFSGAIKAKNSAGLTATLSGTFS